jgi:Protein of unknown function (DUF402)
VITRFQPGDSIAWRVRVRTEIGPGDDLAYVSARTLVHDTPSEVAVFARQGFPGKRRNAEFGGPTTQRHRPVVAWRPGWSDEPWGVWRLLTLKRPQDRHSISAAWHEQTREFHWYIDLTSPLRRTATGFEVVEHGLDIVADPDGGAFRWKDEDEVEVAWAVARGTYTRTEAAELYLEGERAVERLRRERAVLEPWISWAPDPRWAAPHLPTGWELG